MNKNITFIDDLFDVSSIQSPSYIDEGNREREEYNNQIQSKHIRKYKDNSYGINGGIQNDFFPLPPPQQTFQPTLPQQTFQPTLPQQIFQPQQSQQHILPEDISCLTISTHIKNCPICSKFYNSDYSFYIICIILLIIVCSLLVKKLIEKV
jgi:hypothetical protein